MIQTRIQTSNASRCPFCRDDVRRVERVACAACLAPHHSDCWDAHSRCSSCGEAESLRPERELYGEPEAVSAEEPTGGGGSLYGDSLSGVLEALAGTTCARHHDSNEFLIDAAALAGEVLLEGVDGSVCDSLDDSPLFTGFLVVAMVGVLVALIGFVASVA